MGEVTGRLTGEATRQDLRIAAVLSTMSIHGLTLEFALDAFAVWRVADHGKDWADTIDKLRRRW